MKTVIEFTQTHIKVLQRSDIRGEETISFCDVFAHHGEFDEGVDEYMKRIVKDCRIRADQLTVLIPRKIIIMKQMRLPTTNPAEIEKMVDLQLIDQVPYSLDQMVLQTKLIEQDSQGFSRVLVLAAESGICYQYIHLFKKQGVHLRSLRLSSFGMLEWLQKHGSGYSTHSEAVRLLINIDYEHSELCFCQNNALLFSRSINAGFHQNDNDGLSYLIQQIDLSIKNFQQNKMGGEVQQAIIVSSTSMGELLRNAIINEMQMDAVHLSPLMEFLGGQESNMPLMQAARQVSLTAVLGALLGDEESGINLAPAEVNAAWKTKLKMNKMLNLGVHALFVMFIGLGALGVVALRQNRDLVRLEQKLEEIRPLIEGIKQKKQLVDAVDQDFQQRVFVPKLVKELLSLAPDGISFRSMSLNDKGRFELDGFTMAASTVHQFQAQLVNSALFKKVNLQFAKQKRLNNMDVTEFKLSCDLL